MSVKAQQKEIQKKQNRDKKYDTKKERNRKTNASAYYFNAVKMCIQCAHEPKVRNIRTVSSVKKTIEQKRKANTELRL